MLLFHAEMEDTAPASTPACFDHVPDAKAYKTFLDSRPEKLEESAIDVIARLQADHPQVPMHIVHLSAASALPKLRSVRSKGLPLSVETCFHYRE